MKELVAVILGTTDYTLNKVGNLPVISHVINTIRNINPNKIIVTHKNFSLIRKDDLLEIIDIDNLHKTIDSIRETKYILFLYDNAPFITARSLSHLISGFSIENNNILVDKNKDIYAAIVKKTALHTVDHEIDLTEFIQNTKKYYLQDGIETLRVTNCQDIAIAEENFQKYIRIKMMDRGVVLLSPQSVYFSFDTKIAAHTVVHPYVIFGPGVEIGREAEILSFSHIADTKIESKAVIGPFARLREKVRIHTKVKIGNFTEIKNSTIEREARVKHVSYIGDAYIGKCTNIGAGAITCNYNGFEKHFTDIAPYCFIGANVSLVAPIKIHEQAVIGAGSVITNDVPAKSLAIGRAQQIIKVGYKK